MNNKNLSGYAPELYEALKNLLDEIPIIAGDSRHDALSMRIFEANKLMQEIDTHKRAERLNPCPFCGNKELEFEFLRGNGELHELAYARIVCGNPKCLTQFIWCLDNGDEWNEKSARKECAKRWNRRT